MELSFDPLGPHVHPFLRVVVPVPKVEVFCGYDMGHIVVDFAKIESIVRRGLGTRSAETTIPYKRRGWRSIYRSTSTFTRVDRSRPASSSLSLK